MSKLPKDRRRQTRKAALSPRAQELIEGVRRERNEGLVAAKRAFYGTIVRAEQELRAESHRLNTRMNELVDSIGRGDRAGILVAQRIEEPA